MIPASNAQHLMLRDDVVEACRRAMSRLAIETIEQGISLLTAPRSANRARTVLSAGSVNRAVADRWLLRQGSQGGRGGG